MKLYKSCFIAILVFLPLSLISQHAYENIQVKSSYTGSWTTRQAKLVSLIPGYANRMDGSDDFTRYGTYKYLRTDSTGYFYVKKINGRWWMVDPDGYAGVNMAVTSFSSSNIQNDYDITRRLGYNGTGNFLASESQTKSGYNTQNYGIFSFTRRLNFFLTYKNVRKNYYTTPQAVQGSSNHIVVLDPQFTIYCDNLASSNITPFVEERDLLGWFTDNEINFNQDQLRNLVKDLPVGDPSREATLAWAAGKGLSESDCINYTGNVTEAIKQEFAAYLADHYFKTVSEAIRKYDQNHLILGSRLHGRPRAIEGVVAASHEYMDVTSVNFYDRWSPNEQITASSWTVDKPCLVGEFYIKDINVQNGIQSGAGWYVNSQEDRGKFYQNSCLEFLQNKNYIGWHYFRFKDDDDGSNKGIVSNDLTEYTDMTKYMDELNKQVYRIIDHYDNLDRRPTHNTVTKSIPASADTYVQVGATNENNFGQADQLDVRFSRYETERRDAFFKFDLSEFQELLPFIKHAELQFSCTASDDVAHSIFISGIEDNSWEENTLTGALQRVNTDWRSGYNRISAIKSIVEPTTYAIDVTQWVADKNNPIKSFKIHDLAYSDIGIKIASREYQNTNLTPKLIVTFWDKYQTNISLQEENSLRIYPNPVRNFLHIKDIGVVKTEIFSLTGKSIVNFHQNQIDLSGLHSGVYMVKLKYDSGVEIVSRILKL